MAPTTLIVRTAGTNCDLELAHAFQLAGAETHIVHVNRLIEQPLRIESFDLIGFPGGFSYGDDIAAGRIFANRLRHRLLEPLLDAAGRGVPMIGICNGFQVLIKMGLLPDPGAGRGDGSPAPRQVATLTENIGGRFIDRWVPLRAEAASVCVWTRGLGAAELPIAHGEGRFTAPPAVLDRLESRGQVALRYAPGHNPNGSLGDIAGVCDPTGRILGLMPHPERFTDFTHHPGWTRTASGERGRTPAGLAMIRNAVACAVEHGTGGSADADVRAGGGPDRMQRLGSAGR